MWLNVILRDDAVDRELHQGLHPPDGIIGTALGPAAHPRLKRGVHMDAHQVQGHISSKLASCRGGLKEAVDRAEDGGRRGGIRCQK